MSHPYTKKTEKLLNRTMHQLVSNFMNNFWKDNVSLNTCFLWQCFLKISIQISERLSILPFENIRKIKKCIGKRKFFALYKQTSQRHFIVLIMNYSQPNWMLVALIFSIMSSTWLLFKLKTKTALPYCNDLFIISIY